jgi:hypothetical protein
MSGTELAKAVAQLPAHLQGAITQGDFDEFAAGVTSAFPIISYRGRTWRVRKGGEEEVYLNEQQEAVQSIEIVFLRSNAQPSKVYYDEKYTEGDSGPPKCWSANGHKPDAGVIGPIHPTCAPCPMNVWGSKTTDAGKPARACSDVRRSAVSFGYQLAEVAAGERALDDVDVFLLRIPPATLNPLKDYVEKVLKPKGITPWMLITRIGFDTEVSYPKLTFKGLRFLNEDEYAAAGALRDGEDARRILNEATENIVPDDDAEGITNGSGEVSGANAQAPAEATAKAPSASPALQPVEEEELNFSEETEEIAPAPPRAAAVEAEAEQVQEAAADEIAPAPEPVKKKTGTSKKAAAKKKTASKPKPVEEPAAAPPTAADSGGEDWDAMLDSILGEQS